MISASGVFYEFCQPSAAAPPPSPPPPSPGTTATPRAVRPSKLHTNTLSLERLCPPAGDLCVDSHFLGLTVRQADNKWHTRCNLMA